MAAGIKILLMDDDEILRKLTRKKLVRMGFEIETAWEGDEAIEMYQAALDTGRPYDVVILDLVIQDGLDGKETIARLLEIDPGVRAIASSGFVNDPAMSSFWENGFIEILPKPYKTNELEN
ncbi:MAG: response regulator, partial [Gammaproteobacteria bacterium]|nr:response regulator [Gammaproteobacteria bacterium]